MDTKEAIVLAGGLGTRLQSILTDIPKCMAPVNGKPFLTYVLDFLVTQNISKVILSVGFRKEHIINYFGHSYNSIEIEYAVENEPLGTGGAIKLAMNLVTGKNAFVINGDTYFVPDLRQMLATHDANSADITIAVKQMLESQRYGTVAVDKNGSITDFKEKDPKIGAGLINGGIYLINKNVMEGFTEKKFSLENDVFKKSFTSLKMQAYETDAFFLDMGIPEDYIKAQNLINIQKL
jgi:D-glycero-alpha-D-manno-heptose 1-phosphate guanylyltransferase